MASPAGTPRRCRRFHALFGQALIGRQRCRAEEHLKQPVGASSGYEAGSDGFRLHRLLRANAIDNPVVDPASLPVDRRARR